MAHRLPFALAVLIGQLTAGCTLLTDTDRLRPQPVDGGVAAPREQLEPLWARTAAGPGDDYGRGCAIGTDGNIYWVGSVSDGALFPDDEALPLAGASDGFIVRLDPDGHFANGQTYGSSGGDEFYAIARDGSDMWIGGVYSGSVDFGGGTRTTPSSQSVIVHFSNGSYVWDQVATGSTSQIRSIELRDFGPAVAGKVGDKVQGDHKIGWLGCDDQNVEIETGFVVQLQDDGLCSEINLLEHEGPSVVHEISATPSGVAYAAEVAGVQQQSGQYFHDLAIGEVFSASPWSLTTASPDTQEAARAVVSDQEATYWGGRFDGPVDFGDGAGLREAGDVGKGFVHQRKRNGAMATQIIAASGRVSVRSLALTPAMPSAGVPRAYVSGTHSGQLDLDLEVSESLDAFVVGLDDELEVVDSPLRLGGPGDQIVRDIAVTDSLVCVTGNFTESLRIAGLDTTMALGQQDAFVALFRRVPPQ